MANLLYYALAAVLLRGCTAANWCDLESCPGEHIDCTMGNGKFSDNCPSSAVMLNLRNVQDIILKRMNQYRNKVAGGNYDTLESATRMGTLRWNVSFANLARKNVKQCADEGFLYDGCRNTPDFDFVGQNLAFAKYPSSDTRKNLDVILDLIDYWFKECKKASPADLAIFPGTTDAGDVIAHCTQMLKMQATRVGCAAMKATKDDTITLYLACNFDLANVMGWPIYDAGKPTSACKTGANSAYKNLCSPSEVYNANEFWKDYE